MLSVFVIGIGAAAFFSLFPTFTRGERIAADETKAAKLAQRMVEHLQLLKPADINPTTLTGINLVDAGQTQFPLTFTTIPLDDATGYSPSRALKNGTGLLEVQDIAANSKLIRVTVSWKSASGKSRVFTTGTVLGGYR
jgi:hypothetical protein